MAHVAPSLPSRFPCWCRATYSWGGESKRDLGFIEGDLIECLNAGDGSWWMGRLHRDKRAMGVFPSNFVKVLDDSFRPISRTTSPLPPMNGTGTLSHSPSATTSPQKSKTFRKPFTAYASNPTKDGARTPSPNITPTKTKTFRKPFQAYTQASSPNPAAAAAHLEIRSRGPSPNPSRQPSYVQEPSIPPLSGYNSQYGSRAPSPAPFSQCRPASSNGPPRFYDDGGSSPPPPAPPPHRVAYTAPVPRGSPSPTPSMTDRYPAISRGHSPAPTSPGVQGMTPSPLRDAMDDVMSSLHHMEMRRDELSPPEQDQKPLDPWSPEAFDEFRSKPQRNRERPRSSLGIGASQLDDENYEMNHAYEGRHISPLHDYDGSPPHVSKYVERTGNQLLTRQITDSRPPDELFLPEDDNGPAPAPPPKNSPYQQRPNSSLDVMNMRSDSISSGRRLKNRKSAYELGRDMLGRTFTSKSNATNSSSGVQSTATNSTTSTSRTSQSIMSGHSAGGFSATSAGSLARRKGLGSISKSRPGSVVDNRHDALLGLRGERKNMGPPISMNNSSHYSSQGSRPGSAAGMDWSGSVANSDPLLGGLTTPKARKSGFFKKLVESAKTGAASARSSIAAGQGETPRPPIKNLLPNGVTAIAGGSAARDMGLGGGKSGIDWVQVRRDINRSNSLSRNERTERIERCQMMNYPVLAPVNELYAAADGDEGADRLPIEHPTEYRTVNLQLVDKSARFVNSLPPMTNPTSLAQGYVCRPYRSDVQRLRAIFTWVSEKIAWEEDFEGEVDSRRVIQMRRGCAEEVAVLVMEMCSAVGLHAEVVRGFLKAPGEAVDLDSNPRPNHWWNAVIVDDEWKIIDCSLASPTNPKRGQYSSAGPQIAEFGWFLSRPMEICYTHVPSHLEQQHICPLIAPDILLALPCACPPYFKNNIQLIDYDTSLIRIEDLELVHVQFTVPPEIECHAEVTTRTYACDADGDFFESGDTTTTRALAQAEWIHGQKRYTVKALLPGDEGQGTLKVYAGARGLMHSIKDNPYPLAFALPITHTGTNPPYEFLLRHPTPHAQRHDLYVAQPQCARLAVNNTFVFAVRQHPSSLPASSPSPRPNSPNPLRPGSAMSMLSSATGSDYFSPPSSVSGASSTSNQQTQNQKPAKLAIQAPSGKILRLMRKADNLTSSAGEAGDGGVWETIIKIGERGTWRGLVLADRSARWCVFGEWECV